MILLLAVCQLALLASVWPRFVSPNEFSRIFAAHAFVTRGTFQIDPELARYGAIDDVSVHDGRHFSNKAPGLIFAAVPALAALRAVAPKAPLGTEVYVARLVLVSGAALLCAALLAGWLARHGSGALQPAEAACVLLFASVFGVYAGTFFSHAWTGSLLLAAAYLLVGPGEELGPRAAAAGGFVLALAAISEYPAAVVGAPLALAACWGRWRRLLPLAAGALLPLAALALYNGACFGSPWTLSSRMEALPRYQRLAAQTFFGFTPPRPFALAGLLFSPVVGLFFFNPVLLPALAAPVAAWRGGRRRLAVAVAAAAWLLPVVMAGYREWQGGASFGPRYLVLGIPFLVLGLGLLPRAGVRLWILGAVIPSAVVTLLGRVTPPFAIDGAWDASTLRGWALPALEGGLWNHPPGLAGAPWAGAALVAAALVWVVALGIAFLPAWGGMAAGRRWVVPVLAAGLLAIQLWAGRVTSRQRGWLRYVGPSFAVERRPPGRTPGPPG